MRKKMETNAIRTQMKRSQYLEHSTPLHLTSSFVFEDAEDMRASFAEEKERNIYSRFTNPNTSEFVQKVHHNFNNQNIKPVNSDMISGNYDIYYILYEWQCKHGGERFELMKLSGVKVNKEGKTLKVKFSKWNDEMIIKQIIIILYLYLY